MSKTRFEKVIFGKRWWQKCHASERRIANRQCVGFPVLGRISQKIVEERIAWTTTIYLANESGDLLFEFDSREEAWGEEVIIRLARFLGLSTEELTIHSRREGSATWDIVTIPRDRITGRYARVWDEEFRVVADIDRRVDDSFGEANREVFPRLLWVKEGAPLPELEDSQPLRLLYIESRGASFYFVWVLPNGDTVWDCRGTLDSPVCADALRDVSYLAMNRAKPSTGTDLARMVLGDLASASISEQDLHWRYFGLAHETITGTAWTTLGALRRRHPTQLRKSLILDAARWGSKRRAGYPKHNVFSPRRYILVDPS